MKAQRLNLIPVVRQALGKMGVSTVKVTNAVNAALNDLSVLSEEAKLKAASLVEKKSMVTVTETLTIKYKGKTTIPTHFDSWHSAIEKADKVASIPALEIPEVFHEWLNKMKEVPAPAQEQLQEA